MGKVLEIENKEVLRQYLEQKTKKKQMNVFFGELEKEKEKEKFHYVKKLKFDLFKKTNLYCVDENRKKNIIKKINNNLEQKDFKSTNQFKKMIEESEFFKEYITLDYIRDSKMVLVTKEEQLKDEVIIDEIINFILMNIGEKINLYIKKDKKQEIEKLVEFSIQKGTKVKIIFY